MLSFLTVFVNVHAYTLCSDSIVRDGKGFSWLNYCDLQGQKLKFFKDYSDRWTFVTDNEQGDSRYAYRIPYKAKKCSDKTMEADIKGDIWQSWCLDSGQKLEFEKKFGEFVVDQLIGEEVFQWRKPLYIRNPISKSFLQVKSEIECLELEGDTSGRYYPIELSENGEKIEFDKDRNGNFIIDPVSKSRYTSFVGSKKVRITGLPLCSCENLFEPDPSGEFYWIILFKNSLPLVFIESQDTYYYISPATGEREVHN